VRAKRATVVRLLAVALLATASGAGVALLAGGQTRPSPGAETDPTDARDRIVAAYRACAEDERCIKDQLSATVNASPTEAVVVVRDLYSEANAGGQGCHWALHLVGQMLKPRILAGDTLGLDALWASCGYAVLHGAYEDLPLDGDVRTIGRKAFAACANGTLERERVGQCFHPIGHTIEMNLPAGAGAPHLFLAEAACAEGAWSIADETTTGTALKACVSGAHMRHRDTQIRPGSSLRRSDSGTWDDALPQCSVSLFPYACATLYMENVVTDGPDRVAEGRSLLAWCVEKSPEAAEVCGYFYGMNLNRIDPFATRGTLVALCEIPDTDERVILACIRGVLDDLGNVPGRSPVPQTDDCPTGEGAARCAAAASFTVTYPALRALDEHLRLAGRTLPSGV